MKNTTFKLLPKFALLMTLLVFSCTSNKKIAKFTETALADKSSMNLPGDFKNRTYLKRLVGERNNPSLLPGRLIKIESVDSTTNSAINVIRIPSLFSKNNYEPESKIIENGELVKLKINNKSSASASISAVLDLNIGANESYEIFLTDILLSEIPDTEINLDSLAAYYKQRISPIQLNNYYFISNVKISKYSYQKYVEISGDTNINAGSVFALDGKLYNSRDELFQDYFISASLVPLIDLLPTNIDPRPLPSDEAPFIDNENYYIINIKN